MFIQNRQIHCAERYLPALEKVVGTELPSCLSYRLHYCPNDTNPTIYFLVFSPLPTNIYMGTLVDASRPESPTGHGNSSVFQYPHIAPEYLEESCVHSSLSEHPVLAAAPTACC